MFHELFAEISLTTRAPGECFQAHVHGCSDLAGYRSWRDLGGLPWLTMAGSRGDHGYDGYGMLWLVSSKEKFTTQPWAAKLRDGPGLMALGAQTAWGLGSRCGSLKKNDGIQERLVLLGHICSLDRTDRT